MESQQASFNPANASSLSGIMQEVLKSFGCSLENAIPAIVKSYNRTKNVAVVQPAINDVATSGETVEYDTVCLPVFNYGGGGVLVNFPLEAGNTGWIVACDKDISLYKQSLKVSNPNTFQRHRFAFGWFLPDIVKGAVISGDDNGALVIQTLDGATKITLKAGLVNVVSSANLTVTAPNVTITGDVSITGTLSVSGQISSSTDVLSAGISGKTHTHSGVSTGSGNTGAPQ